MEFSFSPSQAIRRGFGVFAGLIAATTLLTSCMDDLDSPDLPPAAYVSIYQGATDAPAMDIFANQNRVNLNPLNYTEIIPYSAFYTGTRDFRFSGFNSATSLLEKNFNLKADSIYSVFVMDKTAGIDAVLVKDVWADPVAEKAQLRIVHLSSTTEKVDLEVSTSKTPLVKGVAFSNASNFFELPTGPVTLTVKSGLNSQNLVQSGTLELKGNRVYTLILRGVKGETSSTKKLDLQLITNYIDY